MSLNKRITNTPIGQRYGWDHLSDVDLDILENNRAAKINVIERPGAFPNADIAECETIVRDIDNFMAEHGELLVEFA